LVANLALEPAAVRGHLNVLSDGRVGKFGWKANVATLVEFMGLAYRNELGVTNPLEPVDLARGCGGNMNNREIDGLPLTAQVAFLDTLDPPSVANQGATCRALAGFTVFKSAGCAGCHTPALPSPGFVAGAIASINLPLYSDLALHDMGPGLADGIIAESALGNEWRTMPLWRLAERTKFLHDGRATTVDAAVGAHGGQAAAAAAAFQNLSGADRQAVIDFLNCI
jgi:CxxC motif-containing protein (DUF1111 family)